LFDKKLSPDPTSTVDLRTETSDRRPEQGKLSAIGSIELIKLL